MGDRDQKARAGRNGAAAKRARRLAGEPVSPYAGRIYDNAEAEFLKACEARRARLGRPFLRATDYLAVVLELGYRRCEP